MSPYIFDEEVKEKSFKFTNAKKWYGDGKS
jgi:hypothetical protein